MREKERGIKYLLIFNSIPLYRIKNEGRNQTLNIFNYLVFYGSKGVRGGGGGGGGGAKGREV